MSAGVGLQEWAFTNCHMTGIMIPELRTDWQEAMMVLVFGKDYGPEIAKVSHRVESAWTLLGTTNNELHRKIDRLEERIDALVQAPQPEPTPDPEALLREDVIARLRELTNSDSSNAPSMIEVLRTLLVTLDEQEKIIQERVVQREAQRKWIDDLKAERIPARTLAGLSRYI